MYHSSYTMLVLYLLNVPISLYWFQLRGLRVIALYPLKWTVCWCIHYLTNDSCRYICQDFNRNRIFGAAYCDECTSCDRYILTTRPHLISVLHSQGYGRSSDPRYASDESLPNVKSFQELVCVWSVYRTWSSHSQGVIFISRCVILDERATMTINRIQLYCLSSSRYFYLTPQVLLNLHEGVSTTRGHDLSSTDYISGWESLLHALWNRFYNSSCSDILPWYRAFFVVNGIFLVLTQLSYRIDIPHFRCVPEDGFCPASFRTHSIIGVCCAFAYFSSLTPLTIISSSYTAELWASNYPPCEFYLLL